MSDSGAAAALRGYRRQTLYALSKIIQGQPEDFFQLELDEDFAVVEPSGKPLEIMQVKDYTSDLPYSKVKDFFFRAANRLSENSTMRHKLISFGDFGSELSEAWKKDGKERKRVKNKLLKPTKPKGLEKTIALDEQDIDRVFNTVELVNVNEGDLEKQVYDFLEKTLAGRQPVHAFELLQKWLLDLSEKSGQVSHHDLLNRLTNVGSYLRDREVHHDEWFATIKPLRDSRVDQDDMERHREDFYLGISARFHHILSNVDIIRPTKLEDIHKAFKDANVVIIHGASGQGKSTLAYRYMHDYVPAPSRFEIVSIDDLRHARSIATALLGHFEAIRSSMYVMVDVEPGSTFWADVVRELASNKNIKLLIAVREEDFQRVDLPQTALGLPKMLELRINREEAAQIYQGLMEHKIPTHILSFDDAWNTFGTSGPLLEFVYLITQNESLRDRLDKQVKKLVDEVRQGQLTQEEFMLLRAVAAASAYATRLDLKKLVQAFELPTPKETIRRYEKEYLLRVSDDGRYVDGLHLLRSQILIELLNDDVLQPWIETLDTVLVTALESDLEAFLLHSFSRQNQYRSQVLEAISQKKVESWLGSAGILRALLWLCVDEHVRKDRQMLDDMIERFNGSWWLTVDGDIAGISEAGTTGWLEGFENVSKGFRDAILDNRQRMASRDNLFSLAKEWLRETNKNLPTPRSDFEWNQFSYFAFWLGFLKCGDAFDLVAKDALQDTLVNLPLELLGNLILSLSYSQEFSSWFLNYQDTVLNRFQKETNTFLIEDDGKSVRIYFLINLEAFDAKLPNNKMTNSTSQSHKLAIEKKRKEEVSVTHSETMRRVKLLRKILPHRSTYGSKGYGHNLGFIEFPVDESIKNMSRAQFFPTQAQQINGIYRGLAVYDHRFVSWLDYAQSELELRKNIVKALLMMQKTLEKHFRKKDLVNGRKTLDLEFWQKCITQMQKRFLLPKLAVDEWGFVIEGQAKDLFDAINSDSSYVQKQNPYHIAHSISAKGLEKYRVCRQKWSTGIENFLRQSFIVFRVKSFRARAVNLSEAEKDRLIAEQGLNQNLAAPAAANISQCLSNLPELQNEFRSRFGHFFDLEELKRFEEKELSTYERLWNLWLLFYEKPQRRAAEPLQDARKYVKKFAPKLMRNIKKTLKELNNEYLTVEVVDTDSLFEGKKSLWIRLDSKPLHLYDDVVMVLEALQAVFDDISYGLFYKHLIEQEFEQVCLLPMCDGKLIAAVVDRIFGYKFFNNQSISFENGEHQEYLPLPKEILTRLNFRQWEHQYLDTSFTLSQSLGNLYTIVAHFSDLSKLDTELLEQHSEKNDDAIRVIQPYFQQQMPVISKYAQNTLDAMVEMINHFNEIETPTSSLQEVIPALKMIHKHLLAFATDEEDHQTTMKFMLGDMPEWRESIKQAIAVSEGVLLAWLDYLLNES